MSPRGPIEAPLLPLVRLPVSNPKGSLHFPRSPRTMPLSHVTPCFLVAFLSKLVPSLCVAHNSKNARLLQLAAALRVRRVTCAGNQRLLWGVHTLSSIGIRRTPSTRRV